MKKIANAFYESPQMKVFEAKVQRVLCASGLKEENDGAWS